MSYPLFGEDMHPDEEILSEGEDDFEYDEDEDDYPQEYSVTDPEGA